MLNNTGNRRVKLCLASPMFFPTYGGSQLRFLRYLPGFSERGIDTRIVTGTPTAEDVTVDASAETWKSYPVGTILPEEDAAGVPVTRVRLPDSSGLRRAFLYHRTLYRHCRLHHPDVVQLVGTLRFNAVPWLKRLRAMGIPSIYAVTITSKLAPKRKAVLRQWLFMRRFRNRALFNALDCIIVNNSSMRGMMRDMGVKTRIEVIPNGVNLQRYSPERNPDEVAGIRERLGIPGDAPVVATVGAVMPRKGSDLLLEAWCRLLETLPGAHLLFVGPRKDLEHPDLGGFSARLKRLAKDSGRPGQVHFVGMADNVEAYLYAADVFVLPSRREGTPNSVLEAMACGVPVVVTPFLGLSEDLGRQGEHYLLADFSPDALAQAIGGLLQDPERRRRLAGSALQWIRQTMDLETSLDRYAALYREIAGK